MLFKKLLRILKANNLKDGDAGQPSMGGYFQGI